MKTLWIVPFHLRGLPWLSGCLVLRLMWWASAEALLDIRDDLLAVKAPVFNEDLVGVAAGNNHSGKVNSRDVALTGPGIAIRP